MIISPHAQKFARNINSELATLPSPKNWSPQFRKKVWLAQRADKIKRKTIDAWFRCPECQKYMIGDYQVLQKHFLEVHVRDRANNTQKFIRFHPDRIGRNERVI